MKKWEELRSASRHSRCSENDPIAAIQYLRQAIEAASQSDPQEVSLMLNSLSNVLMDTGDFSGAEAAARRSIEEEQRYGPPIEESDRLASYHSALAIALQKQGRFSDAVSAVDEAIRVFALHCREEEDLMQNLRRLHRELKQDAWRG
jgi:tetratricopeptide (TPR) repeat protein